MPCVSARGSHAGAPAWKRSEEHTSELRSLTNLVCRLLLEKKRSGRVAPADGNELDRRRQCPLLQDLHARLMLGFFFFFNDAAPPEIYPLSLHDPLPIYDTERALEIIEPLLRVGVKDERPLPVH